jgi:hypothetical protein
VDRTRIGFARAGENGFAPKDGAAGCTARRQGSAPDPALPLGVSVDRLGNLYIADTLNIGAPLAIAVDAGGNEYFGNDQNAVYRVDPGGVLTLVAQPGGPPPPYDGWWGYANPNALAALDGAGNVYFVDVVDNRVQRIAIDGTIVTVAGRSGGAATTKSTRTGSGLFRRSVPTTPSSWAHVPLMFFSFPRPWPSTARATCTSRASDRISTDSSRSRRMAW